MPRTHTKWWLVTDPNDESKCNVHTLPSKNEKNCCVYLPSCLWFTAIFIICILTEVYNTSASRDFLLLSTNFYWLDSLLPPVLTLRHLVLFMRGRGRQGTRLNIYVLHNFLLFQPSTATPSVKILQPIDVMLAPALWPNKKGEKKKGLKSEAKKERTCRLCRQSGHDKRR